MAAMLIRDNKFFTLLSVGKTLNNNDQNQVAEKQFSLKQWFAVGAHHCRLRKTGSAQCDTSA